MGFRAPNNSQNGFLVFFDSSGEITTKESDLGAGDLLRGRFIDLDSILDNTEVIRLFLEYEGYTGFLRTASRDCSSLILEWRDLASGESILAWRLTYYECYTAAGHILLDAMTGEDISAQISP